MCVNGDTHGYWIVFLSFKTYEKFNKKQKVRSIETETEGESEEGCNSGSLIHDLKVF